MSAEERATRLSFLAGVAAGAVGVFAVQLLSRRGLDTRLLKGPREDPDIPPVVVVPGILGSQLLRSDGTPVWLRWRNAVGSYDLSDADLRPGGLLGVDSVLPRLFGFTEYADLLDLLEDAGFRRRAVGEGRAPAYHVFTYDWRQDLAALARKLHEALEALADARGEPDVKFNVIGHSMGGLIARHYLRYGDEWPRAGATVSWAGARRIRNLVLATVPSAGSIPALDAILNGNRVGLSSTTLGAALVSRFRSIYYLLPPPAAHPLLDPRGQPLEIDLREPLTWERFGWGPYAAGPPSGNGAADEGQAFLAETLSRVRAFHSALDAEPVTACPARVVALGGDCLATLARAVLGEEPGRSPRFEAWTREEAEAMFEAGDGRVTRASVLASHLPAAESDELGCGIPEVTQALFGDAEHHGIYREPTFQSALLRVLLRPRRRVHHGRALDSRLG